MLLEALFISIHIEPIHEAPIMHEFVHPCKNAHPLEKRVPFPTWMLNFGILYLHHDWKKPGTTPPHHGIQSSPIDTAQEFPSSH